MVLPKATNIDLKIDPRRDRSSKGCHASAKNSLQDSNATKLISGIGEWSGLVRQWLWRTTCWLLNADCRIFPFKNAGKDFLLDLLNIKQDNFLVIYFWNTKTVFLHFKSWRSSSVRRIADRKCLFSFFLFFFKSYFKYYIYFKIKTKMLFILSRNLYILSTSFWWSWLKTKIKQLISLKLKSIYII